jgi:DNA modification methylase
MFSFAGDTILDPFSGTGSTAIAALHVGRNSICNEIEPGYHQIAEDRLREEAWLSREVGAATARVLVE